jgi:predicted O-methyltransferase YrrM
MVSATATNLRANDRRLRLQWALDHWTFVARDNLESAYVHELFPGIEHSTSHGTVGISHSYELPYGERVLLELITRSLEPEAIFEFGTYTGTTTKLLAEAWPAATVRTIDLPGGGDVIGSAFRDGPANIVSYRADIADFDFRPYENSVDLIYIDASHVYEDVVRDSELAFSLLRSDGVVVWDDYHAAQPDVVRALNEVSRRAKVHHLTGSRLCVHRR